MFIQPRDFSFELADFFAELTFVVVGTNTGVFASLTSSLGTWFQFGSGMPNVPVWDMDYDITDDITHVIVWRKYVDLHDWLK